MNPRPFAGILGRSRRTPRATVTCPECDVTWRGTVDDPCWACEREGAAIVATAPAVRLRS